MTNKKENSTNALTEHLFRNCYQEVFSSLVVRYGNQHIDLIEDALQETFYKALKSWKFNDLPDRPKNWLFTVAKNHLINELRKNSKTTYKDASNLNLEVFQTDSERAKEDQLQVFLACSKFNMKARAKLVFTLKAICGFGVTEIANGLQLKEDNVYRIGQRAKQKLKNLPRNYFKAQGNIVITNHDATYLEQIIYFMFNEGYDRINKSSETAINYEICFEALRLAHLVYERVPTISIKNMLALFYFHMARFDSRVNAKGAFVSLRQQERNQWDATFIQLGFKYLTKPVELDRYYLEALIASLHSTANSFKETNWKEILKLYDALVVLQDTAIVRLNRAICLFELGKYKEGKKALDEIKGQLEDSYLYYSVSMAEYLSDKDKELSEYWYQKSLEATNQTFRKELIRQKMSGIS